MFGHAHQKKKKAAAPAEDENIASILPKVKRSRPTEGEDVVEDDGFAKAMQARTEQEQYQQYEQYQQPQQYAQYDGKTFYGRASMR